MSSQEAIISARVRSARKSQGWSQAELARRAGVNDRTVARVERGEKVRPGNLYSIRTTLGIEDDTEGPHAILPDSVQLCLDVTRKWLLAQDDVDAAAMELTRWMVGRL